MARSKLLSLIAWALVLSLLLAGCNATPSAEPTAAPTTAPAEATTAEATTAAEPTPTPIDTSKQVHLIFYVCGDTQPDEAGYEADLNKLLMRDINADLEFKTLSWGEVFDKFPLIMASGEVFDGAYAPGWLDFFGNVRKGAFVDITDMLPTYCPDILAQAKEDSWKSVTYKGRIYGIPQDGAESYVSDGIIYREDLRKKYNVPEIKKIEDLEAYMLAVKQNEAGMKPCTIGSVDGNYFFYHGLFSKSGFEFANYDYYGLTYQREDPKAQMIPVCDTPQFKEMVTLTEKWQKEGLWTASDMANQTSFTNDVTQSEFCQGMSAVWGGTTGHLHMALDYLAQNHPEWETGFVYFPSPSGHMDKMDALEDGAAVCARSKNPERTLMALNLMIGKEEYNIYLNYGIKDKTFVLDSKGIPQYPEGITQDNATLKFGNNAFGWLSYPEPFPEKRNKASDIGDQMNSIANAQTLLSFYFDPTNVKTEVAALADVRAQYETPLMWGFTTKSVDEDIATLKAKLDAAGLEKVRVEMQKQIDQYLAENAK